MRAFFVVLFFLIGLLFYVLWNIDQEREFDKDCKTKNGTPIHGVTPICVNSTAIVK